MLIYSTVTSIILSKKLSLISSLLLFIFCQSLFRSSTLAKTVGDAMSKFNSLYRINSRDLYRLPKKQNKKTSSVHCTTVLSLHCEILTIKPFFQVGYYTSFYCTVLNLPSCLFLLSPRAYCTLRSR